MQPRIDSNFGTQILSCVRYGMHYAMTAALERMPETQRAMATKQLHAPKIVVTFGGVATGIHFRATEAELRELCEEIVRSLQGGTKLGAIDVGPSAMMKGLLLFQRQGLQFASNLLRTEEAYMVRRTKGLGELQSQLRAINGTTFPNINSTMDRFEAPESSPSTSTGVNVMSPQARARVQQTKPLENRIAELKAKKKSTENALVKAQIQKQIRALKDGSRDRSSRRKRNVLETQCRTQQRQVSRQHKKSHNT